MATLVCDPYLEKRLIARRRRIGIDARDEVWDGVYVIYPPVDNEHQAILSDVMTALMMAVARPGLGKVFPGVNVSDRRRNWRHNFRCPDVVVFLKETKAKSYWTHWCGGPDFCVEIVSPHDRTREKLPFYEKVGTRELLVIDRDPWALTLYQLQEGRLLEVGRSTPEESRTLASEVVSLTWRLTSEKGSRPQIEIVHADGVQSWVVQTDNE
jgi:Uma2 family endonuclease